MNWNDIDRKNIRALYNAIFYSAPEDKFVDYVWNDFCVEWFSYLLIAIGNILGIIELIWVKLKCIVKVVEESSPHICPLYVFDPYNYFWLNFICTCKLCIVELSRVVVKKR